MNSIFASQFADFHFRKIPLIIIFASILAMGVLVSLRPAHAIVSPDTDDYDQTFPFPVSHQNPTFCQGRVADGPIGCY